MSLSEKIERAFAARLKPAQVRLGDECLQLDSDTDEAIWFSGRDWHGLTRKDWEEHSAAIFFFDSDSFAYYLPSLLLLATGNPPESLSAVESLIGLLDRTPDPEALKDWYLAERFLGLRREELEVLKEWLLEICEYAPYKGWGTAASGPGDHLGRAYDIADLLQKEVERRHLANG